jgi:hypothetical protein
VFASQADNLVPGDTNGEVDIRMTAMRLIPGTRCEDTAFRFP